MIDVQTTALVLFVALVLDALIGDPDWLWQRLPHPVVLMGKLIQQLDDKLNSPADQAIARRIKGALALVVILAVACAIGIGVSWSVSWSPSALIFEVIIVAMLLAQRSLYEHVDRVRKAFKDGGLNAARKSVSMIVGRDPETLDEAGVCRAAIESSAENFSDGIFAPAFWYLIAGLPGLLVYKFVNTADSMIGHRNEKYLEFGWASARFDDVLNLVPARLSALFFALAAVSCGGSVSGALRAMWRDAGLHRSPNAGWPEAAMAGGLGLALAGPRVYGSSVVDDPWMNGDGNSEAQPTDIGRALILMVAACAVQGVLVGCIAAVQFF